SLLRIFQSTSPIPQDGGDGVPVCAGTSIEPRRRCRSLRSQVKVCVTGMLLVTIRDLSGMFVPNETVFLSIPTRVRTRSMPIASRNAVAKRRSSLGCELGLLENIERFGALRAAYIGADNEPLSIGENLGALAAAAGMHGPSHVPAARLRQDESLSTGSGPVNRRTGMPK